MSLAKEKTMAESRPKKVGEYDRPLTRTSSTGTVIGIIVLIIVLIVLAVILF
jgi:hypothetical protein